MWLVAAAACTFLLGFRFYAKFIAARVMALDDRSATPAERFRDGHDFEPTNKWILLGHHFAAIAGPGPLVGPTLGGPVRISAGHALDPFRRRSAAAPCRISSSCSAPCGATAKRSGQMAREEIGIVGGFVSLVTVLLIMIVLLAVVGLVVVNALKGSPWGTFTIAMTIPIARASWGLYLRYLAARAKCWNARLIGFVLVVASIFGGKAVSASPAWAPLVHLGWRRARHRHHRLWIFGQRSARVAAARSARLPEHLCQTRRHVSAGAWASALRIRIWHCRRSRDLSMAPDPSLPARSSRSALSPLPAEPSPAFMR